MRRETTRRLIPSAGLLAVLLAGGQAQAIEWGSIFGGSAKPEQSVSGQKPGEAVDIGCPDVQILDGTAAHRVPAGSSGGSVRYQFSIRDVARECVVQGSSLTIKVGVEGLALLGPAGSPGGYTVPLRFVIVEEATQKPITSKTFRVNASIPADRAQAPFVIVSEPLVVPVRADADTFYTVKVGFDAKGGGEDKKPRKRKGKTKPAED